jgi:putative spermidine/putrescine transport system substrate-binding protein
MSPKINTKLLHYAPARVYLYGVPSSCRNHVTDKRWSYFFSEPGEYLQKNRRQYQLKINKFTTVSIVAALSVALTVPALTSASAATNYATITTQSQGGGPSGLIAACQKEGQLNVIALPLYWADYGSMITGFKAAYGVKIDEANPEGSSQDEINAAITNKGTNRSPDVFDIGLAIAEKYKSTGTFASYRSRLWNYIDGHESGNSEYIPNYTGIMTIGYSGKFGTITSLNDLFDPKFKGAVALNGDPLGSSAGINGLFMINKALGGTFDDVSKGLAWFKKMKSLGNFINVDPTEATITSGQTPVVIDNGYVQAGIQKKFAAAGVSWKLYTPAAVGSTYNSAVSAWAPHPACARLWMEYTLGEKGANVWAIGGASPTLWQWMLRTGRASASARAQIGSSRVKADKATADQTTAARAVLKTAWPAAVGG